MACGVNGLSPVGNSRECQRYLCRAVSAVGDRSVRANWLTHCVLTYEDFSWASPECLAECANRDYPWRHYLDTEVQFDVGVVRPADDGDGQEPPFGPLHVVTAVQPDADPDSAESAARVGILDQELKARAIRAIPVVGSSFDGTHREESRAIFGLTDAEARGLGARFGQVAVVAWRGEHLSVLACASERSTHRRWCWHLRAAADADPGVGPS